jgi:hypothetical protein
MSNAKAGCEKLLEPVMPFAEEMLTKHREFFPFGGTMACNGQICHAGGCTGDEHSPSTDVIALLQRGFQAGAKNGEYKATTLVYDVRTIPPGREVKQDAIAVALDHRDSYSIVVFFPYSFGSDAELIIEDPFAVQGESKIFVSKAR